jgi:hypothetical protein
MTMRKFLNSLLANGVWFAALMFNLLSAATTTLIFLVVAIVTKWINLKL